MLLNLQTLALHSRDDQDSDSDDDDFGADDEDEDDAWRTVVDRDIFVDGVRVGWIKGVVLRREEMAGCEFAVLLGPGRRQMRLVWQERREDERVSSDANERWSQHDGLIRLCSSVLACDTIILCASQASKSS